MSTATDSAAIGKASAGIAPRCYRSIASVSNPLIKRMRRLRDKRYRKAEKLFLAEGLRLATEARETGVLPRWLFVGCDLAQHLGAQYLGAVRPLARTLIEETLTAGGEVIATTPAILSSLSGKDNAQTVIGIYSEPDTNLASIDRSTAPIWLVADRLRDPGNMGTILRTGDAVGAGGLILIDESADPFSVEAVRASMGAIFTQKLARARWNDFLPWLRSAESEHSGGQLVASCLSHAQDYQAIGYEAPVFILIGNESQGLSSACIAAADVCVKIPMLGKADSLNAAVAAAVMAYEVLNQRRRV